MAVLWILSPWLFGFSNMIVARLPMLYLGIFILILAVGTNYELGVVKLFNVSAHLTIDIIIGTFMAISPWLFHFNRIIFLPHLLLGLTVLCIALLTRTVVGSSTSISS